MLLRPTALISPWIEGQLTPPKIPQECECWNSTRFQWKKLCEMTTSQCAYLVSTRKSYAGVHQCQGGEKKVTHTLIQALLMLVSCTLKTSQVELPLHFLKWCFFGWQKGEGGPLRDLVPKYQWKLWILGLCRREQTRFSWKCVWQKNKNKSLFAQHKNPDVEKTNNISVTASVARYILISEKVISKASGTGTSLLEPIRSFDSD